MKFILPLFGSLGFFLPIHAGELPLIEDARSAYVISHAADAPESVRLAAREIQRVLHRASGVTLAIANEAGKSPAIRLLSAGSLPHDGFEIRQEGDCIVIAGNNQLAPSAPDPWFVPSHGTYYGALEFLERFSGVRWLMPGDLGEDVPRFATLRVAIAEPILGAPSFAVRAVSYIGESDPGAPGSRRAVAVDWMKHHRLTNAIHPQTTAYGHSWDDYIKPADMEAHPEWKSSNGAAVRNDKVQFFCTTAPGLVETFARRVIETMDRNPGREMSSISPTDGGGFCTCDRCIKLTSTDPHGKRNHSLAILTFYKEVAEIIARERPGKRLGGFVYYNYQYPPEAAPTLPDNLSLCWAPLNYYGYGLLKPVYRAEFSRTMARWCEITPRFFYHNYSTWMRSFHGAPLPVSLDILNLELPAAADHRAWGARMIGSSAWGVNAPVNYLISKQLWNARIDPRATLNEWLERAYGPGWNEMRLLYEDLDARMLAHKEVQSPIYKGSQYEVNEEVMKEIYAPAFPFMERHYQAAIKAAVTDQQRLRLTMFGDNLTQLHFSLRKAGLIAADSPSIFRRDDEAYAAFLESMHSSLSLYSDSHGIYTRPIWKGEWGAE